MERESSSTPPARVLVAIGLIAGSTLAFQVLLTRLLSAVLAYHLTFLAISLALLGSGSGAILVYVRPVWFDRRPLETLLARWSIVCGLLFLMAVLVLVRLDYLDPPGSVGFALNLAAASVVAAAPLLAAGTVIALAMRGYADRMGWVYAADLVGAGVGAFVVVPLLWVLSAPSLIAVLGAVAGVAAALAAGVFARARRFGLGLATLAIGLTILSSQTRLLYLPPAGALSDAEQVADRWTPISRVLGYVPPGSGPFALLIYDRAFAPVMKRTEGEPYPDWQQLRLGPQSIAYELVGPGRTLIIGGGGGRDIYNALSSGQRQVDVIELNEGIRQVVDDDMRRWSLAPYSQPGVTVTIGDGRSVLAADRTRYDHLELNFTDTLSASSASAFALTENNLYTLEAFREYLGHLAPRGVLSVTRLYRLTGDEALRATVLMLEALRLEGFAEPRRHVVVILGRDFFGALFGTILARREPFTDDELATIRELAAQRGEGVAFAPGGPYFAEWAALAEAPSAAAFCASYRMNVCPPTDDKPFFFNMTWPRNLGRPLSGYHYTIDPMFVLVVALGILVVLAAVLYALPLALVRGVRHPPLGALAFFAAIGLGYILLEIALIQRFVLFLGSPVYALSVVLSALLTFTGLGSLCSVLARRPRAVLIGSLVTASVLIGAGAFMLLPISRALMDQPFVVRVAAAVVLVAPFGLTMGMAMPIGLRRLEDLYPGAVPYAIGVNGAASVVASVLAVAVAATFGFTVVSLLAASCYAAALTHAVAGRWADGRATACMPATSHARRSS